MLIKIPYKNVVAMVDFVYVSFPLKNELKTWR